MDSSKVKEGNFQSQQCKKGQTFSEIQFLKHIIMGIEDIKE